MILKCSSPGFCATRAALVFAANKKKDTSTCLVPEARKALRESGSAIHARWYDDRYCMTVQTFDARRQVQVVVYHSRPCLYHEQQTLLQGLR